LEKIKVVSVFSGCGGSDLGIIGGFEFNKIHYDRLPFQIELSLDIDKKALLTLEKNIDSKSVICDDICKIDSSKIPDHDVLIGGFPCQSFSTVNPTKNPDDDRAQLYLQMVRILKDKQPKAFIAENVKGLYTLRNGKIFKRIINQFEETGYNINFELINSADYGVPQKRERLIMVGIRNDLNVQFKFPNRPNINNWVPLSVAVPLLKIPDSKYYFSERAVSGMRSAKNNMKRGLAQNLTEPCLTVTSHLAKVSLNSRDPVLLVDSDLYRRFTPREAARIQSFPDSFEFVGSDTDAYRQIGNAIPPVVFWHISNELSKLLYGTDNKTISEIGISTNYKEVEYSQ